MESAASTRGVAVRSVARAANMNRASKGAGISAPVLPFHGNDRELERWFRREVLPLEPVLTRFLRRNWRNSSEIGDLRQEAYIRLFEAARRAHPICTKAFLFLIVRNLMIDRLRQRRVVAIETLTDFEWLAVSADEPSPEDHVAARQELRLLQKALDGLPLRCRQVVILRKVEGWSQREVARHMGITEETAEHQLAKGLRILAKSLRRSRKPFPGAGRETAADGDSAARHGVALSMVSP